MGLTRTAGSPAIEPVSLEEAKLHLRVDHASEDDLIEGLVSAAREACEVFTRRSFITSLYSLTLDRFPRSCDPGGGVIFVPRPPLISLQSIAYYDGGGSVVNWLTDVSLAQPQVDTSGVQGRILPAINGVWPTTQSGRINAVTLGFSGGYGPTAADVPAGIKAAIKLLVGNLYENRESTVIGTIVAELPDAVQSLLWPFTVRNYIETTGIAQQMSVGGGSGGYS